MYKGIDHRDAEGSYCFFVWNLAPYKVHCIANYVQKNLSNNLHNDHVREIMDRAGTWKLKEMET